MRKRWGLILFAILLSVGCGLMEDESNEGSAAMDSGDDASVEDESQDCVSFAEDCPDHCYTGGGAEIDQEKGCYRRERVEGICSETPRLPDEYNATQGRLHVPSGKTLATSSVWEEFTTDEWEVTHTGLISCSEL